MIDEMTSILVVKLTNSNCEILVISMVITMVTSSMHVVLKVCGGGVNRDVGDCSTDHLIFLSCVDLRFCNQGPRGDLAKHL